MRKGAVPPQRRWDEVIGGASQQNNQVIVVAQGQPWMSDLLSAIREINEVIPMQEKTAVCGTLQSDGAEWPSRLSSFWASMPSG